MQWLVLDLQSPGWAWPPGSRGPAHRDHRSPPIRLSGCKHNVCFVGPDQTNARLLMRSTTATRQNQWTLRARVQPLTSAAGHGGLLEVMQTRVSQSLIQTNTLSSDLQQQCFHFTSHANLYPTLHHTSPLRRRADTHRGCRAAERREGSGFDPGWSFCVEFSGFSGFLPQSKDVQVDWNLNARPPPVRSNQGVSSRRSKRQKLQAQRVKNTFYI